MIARRLSFLGLTAVLMLGGSLAGCGHSEEEWQKQLEANKKVQADLDAERTAHQKTQDELKKAQAQIEQLKKDLATAEELNKQGGSNMEKLRRALKDAEEREAVLKAAQMRLKALREKLEALKKFNLAVSVRHHQIVIEMPGDVLFAPGSELLSKEGKEVILKVAEVISKDSDLMNRYYQVVGHTDNAPYSGQFKDNVGLSVMRAREVYNFLTAKMEGVKGKDAGGGLPPEHWSAAGYGDLDPVKGTREKQTPDEKKRNRRVEIAVLPDASELMKLDDSE